MAQEQDLVVYIIIPSVHGKCTGCGDSQKLANLCNYLAFNFLPKYRFLSDVFFWTLRFAIGGDSTLDYGSAVNVIG